ncbi:MAG: hypothetical protein NZM43_06950 [Saprospiraceae bacterium]|nr:hypothetical protein [Saprospiraceae bacterium]MDW8484047.1 hypothetical protein [Saprospiraceae bacterium]
MIKNTQLSRPSKSGRKNRYFYKKLHVSWTKQLLYLKYQPLEKPFQRGAVKERLLNEIVAFERKQQNIAGYKRRADRLMLRRPTGSSKGRFFKAQATAQGWLPN